MNPLPLSTSKSTPPLWALRLGYAGLIPFVLGAALIWLVQRAALPYVMLALSAYAAVIISFLGGIHWGLAMREGSAAEAFPFVWGVAPSLVAWVAVVMPPWAGLVVSGVMLVACYAVDRHYYVRYGMAAWLPLRMRLTIVASLSCFFAASGL